MNDQPSNGRPSGVPYPSFPPTARADLPEQRGAPGAPASWGLRAGARLFDYFLISLPFVALMRLVGVEQITKGPDAGQLTGPLWVLVLLPIAYMAYEIVLSHRYGQTVGKRLCRITVVDWSTGSLLTLQQAATREFIPGVFLLVASLAPIIGLTALGWLQFVPLVVYATVVANPIYRGAHDTAAGSIVLAAPRRSARS
ncbi:MAG: RDD family protein [Actinomycetes bacterium]